MKWIHFDPAERSAHIMWLHGPPCSGKTWLSKTIAMHCEETGIQVASFFYQKSDSTRNTVGYLIPTLVHQFTRHFPAFSDQIELAIMEDPMIFGRSTAIQFQKLIFEPMTRLRPDDVLFPVPFVVVIDGLDQCDNDDVQCSIIRMIINMSNIYHRSHILFLVTSCAYQRLALECMVDGVLSFPVDAMYLSDDNVRVLLDDGLRTLRFTHYRKYNLDPTWPLPHMIEQLVSRASGHVPYVTTILRHLSHSPLNPAEHLDLLLNLTPSDGSHPFAELDTLYSYIISSSSNSRQILYLLLQNLHGNLSSIRDVESIMYLEVGSVGRIFSEVKSIVECNNDTITFHHSSFADYLVDPTRCRDLYMDPGEVHALLAHMWFEQIHSFGCGFFVLSAHLHQDKTVLAFPDDRPPVKYRVKSFLHHLKHARPTKELRTTITQFQPHIAFELSAPRSVTVTQMSDFLHTIRVMVSH